LLLAAGALCAGCGGISGSHSVSPASFFLPGLIQYDVPAPKPDDATPPPVIETQPFGSEKPLPG